MKLNDYSIITPRQREILRRIVEILDEIEPLEQQYRDLEDEFDKVEDGATLVSEGAPTPRVLPLSPPAQPPRPSLRASPAARSTTSAKRITWSETKALFERRDQLRESLWLVLLRVIRFRKQVVETMFEVPPPEALRVARLVPSSRRDLTLAKLLNAQPQKDLRKIVSDVLAYAARAPVTATAVRAALASVRHVEGRIIAGNIGLCYPLARRFCWSSIPIEDLLQEAATGLQKAVERFEVHRGLRLSTYSSHWITHAVRRTVEDGGMVRIPNGLHQVKRDVAKLLGEGQSLEQAAGSLGLTVKRVHAARFAGEQHRSLDADPPNAAGATLLDRLTSAEEVNNPEALLERGDQARLVRDAMASLDSRSRHIVEQRAQGLTLGVIGEGLGLSRERIRQIEASAIKRIRKRLGIGVPPTTNRHSRRDQ